MPLNYCTAAVVVRTRIPMHLQRSDLTAAVDSPSMYDRPYDTLRCDCLVFLIAVTTLGRIHNPDNLHSIPPAKTEDVPNYKTPKESPGYATIYSTKNGAIPREGAFSRPAKREGQGKAATE